MAWVLTVLAYSLPFLGVVLVITVVHEFGHFIVARRCGVRVHAFSVMTFRLSTTPGTTSCSNPE